MTARELDRAIAARRYRARRWARINAALGFTAFAIAAAVFIGLLLIGTPNAR